VILLNNVIQEFALPQTTTLPEGSILFQRFNSRWISAVLIDVDHPGHRVTWMR